MSIFYRGLNVLLFSVVVMSAIGVLVRHPMVVLAGQNNPIIWKTNYAKLAASNFYIRIGNQYFYGAEPMRITSDPGSDRTTLEATWQENGVEMRLNMYFTMTDKLEWKMEELRTYNGERSGDWMYYKTTESNDVTSLKNNQNYRYERRFVPSNGTDAEVFCGECSITAFLDLPLAISEQGYSLEVMTGQQPGQEITVSTDPTTGYGVNVLLRNSNKEVVTNQEGLAYDWNSLNEAVAAVYSGDIPNSDGNCAYGIKKPCPKMNGQIAGKSPGVTKIQVRVSRDGYVIASNEFDVKVVAPRVVAQPVTTSSPVPTATSIPSPTPSPMVIPVDDGSLNDEQLKQELASLQETVGEMKLDVKRQREELNVVQRALASISDFLQRWFSF